MGEKPKENTSFPPGRAIADMCDGRWTTPYGGVTFSHVVLMIEGVEVSPSYGEFGVRVSILATEN